jgi:hypothetical protein
MLEYIGDRPSRSTRDGGTKTPNETAAEPVRNDKLACRRLDEIARSNSGSYLRAGR